MKVGRRRRALAEAARTAAGVLEKEPGLLVDPSGASLSPRLTACSGSEDVGRSRSAQRAKNWRPRRRDRLLGYRGMKLLANWRTKPATTSPNPNFDLRSYLAAFAFSASLMVSVMTMSCPSRLSDSGKPYFQMSATPRMSRKSPQLLTTLAHVIRLRVIGSRTSAGSACGGSY